MPDLFSIRPPHEVRDQNKLAGLVAAYRAEQPVTPVVVLTDEDDDRYGYALCGSHRIAAAREVYAAEGRDPAAWQIDWIEVDISEIREAAEAAGDEAAVEALAAIVADSSSNEVWIDWIEPIWAYLPADARAALEDQR